MIVRSDKELLAVAATFTACAGFIIITSFTSPKETTMYNWVLATLLITSNDGNVSSVEVTRNLKDAQECEAIAAARIKQFQVETDSAGKEIYTFCMPRKQQNTMPPAVTKSSKELRS